MDNNIEQPHLLKKEEKDNYDYSKIELTKKSQFDKLEEFLGSRIRPYIKRRNLSDPFEDHNYDGGCKTSIEVGIKISF